MMFKYKASMQSQLTIVSTQLWLVLSESGDRSVRLGLVFYRKSRLGIIYITSTYRSQQTYSNIIHIVNNTN